MNEQKEMIQAQIDALRELLEGVDLVNRGAENRCNSLAAAIVDNQITDTEILNQADGVLQAAAGKKYPGRDAHIALRTYLDTVAKANS